MNLDNEQLAEFFIKQSGKVIHASDCATSNAPAMKPGPCDCGVDATDLPKGNE